MLALFLFSQQNLPVQRSQKGQRRQRSASRYQEENGLRRSLIVQLRLRSSNISVLDSKMDTVVEIVAEIFGVDRGTGYRITLGLTLIFVFVFMFIMILRAFGVIGGSAKRGKRSVVIIGVSGSGKTLLFSRLTSGHAVTTFTSMMENAIDGISFHDGGRKYRLIDLPGADRIRKTSFDQCMKVGGLGRLARVNAARCSCVSDRLPYVGWERQISEQCMTDFLSFQKEDIAALIYVIDSSTFQKDCRETAEFLYEVLSHPIVAKQRRRLPVAIACNKQDNPLSKGAQVIRKGLEKELSVLNKTRAASLQTTDGTGGKSLLITDKHGDSEFKFEDLRQSIDFIECAAGDDEQLDELKDWLKQL